MRMGGTGTFSCPMFSLPSKRLPKHPLASIPSSSSLGGCWMCPEKRGRLHGGCTMGSATLVQPTGTDEIISASNKVLLLIPNAACKFLAQGHGPYIVLKRMGTVNFCLQQPGKHADTQIYHVNLLKNVAVTTTYTIEHTLVQRGADLTPF